MAEHIPTSGGPAGVPPGWVDTRNLDAETVAEIAAGLPEEYWRYFGTKDGSTDHAEAIEYLLEQVGQFQAEHAARDWADGDYWECVDAWISRIMAGLRANGKPAVSEPPKTWCITSTSLVNSPGMVRNCIHMWRTGDQMQALAIFNGLCDGRIPIGVVLEILKAERPFETEEDSVIINDKPLPATPGAIPGNQG